MKAMTAILTVKVLMLCAAIAANATTAHELGFDIFWWLKR